MITEETALLYCTNKMKMIQRIDGMSKQRVKVPTDSLTVDLKMHEEEKARNRSKLSP